MYAVVTLLFCAVYVMWQYKFIFYVYTWYSSERRYSQV